MLNPTLRPVAGLSFWVGYLLPVGPYLNLSVLSTGYLGLIGYDLAVPG